MLQLMVAWRSAAAAASTATSTARSTTPAPRAWTPPGRIADAFMGPRLGTSWRSSTRCSRASTCPPSGQYSGWYQYFDRDIRKLLGMKIKAPFETTTAATAS